VLSLSFPLSLPPSLASPLSLPPSLLLTHAPSAPPCILPACISLLPSSLLSSSLFPPSLLSSSSSLSSFSSSSPRSMTSSALEPVDHEKASELSGLLQRCYGVSSWYKAPEFGVEGWELLSRASAFLLPLPESPLSGTGGSRVVVVTSAHIVHPFKFPKYYPESEHPWLHLLTPDHVRTKFEVRDSRGALLSALPLRKQVWAHPTLDVALALPKSGEELLRHISAAGREPHVTSLALKPLPLLQDQNHLPIHTHFVGHTLLPETEEQDQVPTVMSGILLGGTGDGRAFARTWDPSSPNEPRALEMGMCGGPVLDKAGECVGCVEGVVSSGPPMLQGSAVIITADRIHSFVQETEPELY